ncbi:MAG: tyrosine-type recombinase/integrase, partial [Armatimonadota bacterium]
SPITAGTVQQYLMTHENWKPVTVQKVLVVLRRFCWYLHRYDLLSVVPDLSMLCPRVDAISPMTLSPVQVRELLASVETVLVCPQWPLKPHTVKAVIALLYGAGLRLSEALNLKVDDVDLQKMLLVIQHTKFNKTRLVPLHSSLNGVLEAYAKQRDAILGPPRTGSPFFPSRRGRSYHTGTIEQAFARLRRHLGWESTIDDRPLCLHSLRHYVAALIMLRRAAIRAARHSICVT